MTCDYYLEQAKSNEQAARSLEQTYPDWAITICFYAALHWVEYYACITECNIELKYPWPSRHNSRKDYVRDLANQLGNRSLRNAYIELEGESRKARYLQDITTNAKLYYTKNKFRVTQSFQNLQKIKQVLGS
ncbi:hypothetical protein [Nostoc sp.]|uniref:hypothetical protein n=1 Tax=Nostoc sp. TaxID=1180 RepID=UPI0035931A62